MLAVLGSAALVGVAAKWFAPASWSSSESVFEIKSRPVEAAPVCPWRFPSEDLPAFFPEATRYQTETRILSGRRLALAQRLGRTPSAEENSLQLHRVFQDQHPLGAVLARRVKGEFGAIEIVLAVRESGQVRGVRLQRLREPEPVAAALENPKWLEGFQGMTAEPDASWERPLRAVPPEARPSAQAVADGVRSLLILLDVATAANALSPHAHH